VQIGTPRQVYEEPADTYVADFLGAANLMEIDVVTAGAGALRLGDWALTSQRCEATEAGRAHAVIRPERVRIEEHGSAGENRVPAMVERVVFLGAATQVMLRLAAGVSVQALMQNDGSRPDLAQGTPVHCYLPPDALRVLAGSPVEAAVPADEPLVAT
jgi:ABC-type Fe3+/spermidine/putrescine transport system ATPase subunit